jgi:hypothetical protein
MPKLAKICIMLWPIPYRGDIKFFLARWNKAPGARVFPFKTPIRGLLEGNAENGSK